MTYGGSVLLDPSVTIPQQTWKRKATDVFRNKNSVTHGDAKLKRTTDKSQTLKRATGGNP